MNKTYKIVTLIFIFILFSSYNPNDLNSNTGEKKNFFLIKKIIINNTQLVKKSVIQERLNVMYKKNIFLIKRKYIQESLQKIDFLEKIEVKKKYPDTIIVSVIETKPIATIYKNQKKYFLDTSSNLIPFSEIKDIKNLPNVFGEGSQKHLVNFVKKLEKNNFPINKIKSFSYFPIGRWDLQFENNKIIKFPYNLSDILIVKISKLLNDEDFKNYNIIDLRVDGKIIVE